MHAKRKASPRQTITSALPGADALRRVLERWLLRRGHPESRPIELTHRRIYVLPSGSGLVFAAALLVMLIASINYSLSLGYGLVFVLAGAGLASIFHAYRNLLGIRIRPGRCEPVFAGEAATFCIVLDNSRATRLPALGLRLREASARFELKAGETRVVELTCASTRRGRLDAGRSVLETCWPLGLVRAWSVFIPALSCTVYPAPERNAPPLPDSLSANGGGEPCAQPGHEDFSSLRNYQTADSPRHVAWKVLARGGPLLTKQFAGEQGRELALDWASLPAQLDVEQRLSRLSAWLLAAERSGRAYSLTLVGHRIPLANGRDHLHRCLSALAHFGERAQRLPS